MWKNLSIGKKYGIGFTITIALFAIAIILVFIQLQFAKDEVTILNEKGMTAVEVSEMASLARSKDIRVADYIESPLQAYVNQFEDRRQTFNELQAEYQSFYEGTDLEDVFNNISDMDSQVNNLFLNKIVGNLSNEGEVEAARARIQTLRGNLVEQLNTLQYAAEEDMANANTSTGNAIQSTLMTLVIAGIIALVIGSLIMAVVSRMVRKNMNALVQKADQIADGELYHEDFDYDSKDEIGQLGASINAMKGNLQQLIREISTLSNQVEEQSRELSHSSAEVKEGSEQIASTMQELSSSSEQQASDASNLSEMMSTLTRKIRSANDESSKVSTEAKGVLDNSNHGKELMDTSVTQMREIHSVMQQAVERVHRLDKQSGEISKLVQVIRDIADQTNLLALNAAIEAARAGEHGKGFAVVAEEVRKLAEQVSDSVGEITGMVDGIQTESKEVSQSLETGYNQVEEGTTHMEETGATFSEIQTSIGDMVASIDVISSNLDDIDESTSNMNQSIESVASSSEEAAAGVEETTASVEQSNSSMEEVSRRSGELSDMSNRLSGLVGQFRLDDSNASIEEQPEEETEEDEEKWDHPA
ncbi:methyl-accepting chemotaxis protein [Salimicrobium halophilum]|uniref:Methyl-accepting chemotaxis protein n=1 Tax=Salimicrobium halophilum TaxID=86666 RepID=A0A1G8W944_9BACI|nr:methyl-accepting chemotaxis protein [Salimicrobium halophilum]SDJ74788.1 methyl-accepting chemotaxis protein [Salimicrobium halophilum]